MRATLNTSASYHYFRFANFPLSRDSRNRRIIPNNFDNQGRRASALYESEALFVSTIDDAELVQKCPGRFLALKRFSRRRLQWNRGTLE